MARELFNLTKSLGVKLVMTRKTEQEFLDVLEKSNKRFRAINASPKFLKSIDDEFISSFAREIESTTKQTWGNYHRKMKGLRTNLEKNWGIDYYEEIDEDILRSESFPEVAKKVSSCFMDMRGFKKEEAVAEHDAYHLILVKNLRKGEKPSLMLGPKYWFLTYDQTLLCAEEFVDKKMGYDDHTPASMLANLWLQLISPFLTTITKDSNTLTIFSDFLRSKFAVVPFRIPPDDLIVIQGAWTRYDWLETEDVQELLNKRFVRSYVAKIKNALEKGENVESLKSEFDRTMFNELNSSVAKKVSSYDKKIDDLEQKLQDGIKETETIRERIAKEERFKRIWRTLAGIFAFIFFSTNLYILLSRILPWDVFTISYLLGSSVIGAILLMIAIAYERVKVSLGGNVHSGDN